MLKQTLFTVAVCFGVGVGLARLLPVAHASKCALSGLGLELEAIEGDVDPSTEQEFWSETASVNGALAPTLGLFLGSGPPSPIELEPQ